MGWGHCGTDTRGRSIGYMVPATCDELGCDSAIDRGLAHACGGMHGGGVTGCGRYFCAAHLFVGGKEQLCRACSDAEAAVLGTPGDELMGTPGDADDARWAELLSRPLPDAIAELRDRAVDEHRAGRAEPMEGLDGGTTTTNEDADR